MDYKKKTYPIDAEYIKNQQKCLNWPLGNTFFSLKQAYNILMYKGNIYLAITRR